MDQIKLNLGCGAVTPAGWTNVDWALGARLARVPLLGSLARKLGIFNLDWSPEITLHDLTRPFPWKDDSVDFVYSSHTLEHLDRSHGVAFLAECFRVLRVGGRVRIVVPDLAALVEEYQTGRLPADLFVQRLGVSVQEPGDGPVKRRLAFLVRYPHACMYDRDALLAAMRNAGFEAEPRDPFDSALPGIRDIEIEDRTRGAVIVEGTKPARG